MTPVLLLLLQVSFCLLFTRQLNGAVHTSTKSGNDDDFDTHNIQKRQIESYDIPASVDRERLTKHHVRIRARVESPNNYWPNTPTTQVCPQDNIRVLINGVDCPVAIDSFGHHLCYRYEHRFRSCCEKCIQLRDRHKPGCEYGDHSHQCKTMEPYLCYEHQNREICCGTCPRFRKFPSGTAHGCEYGDMTPRCKLIIPSMCYRQDIQRLCCHTCPILKSQQNPGCPYGDHDGFLCATLRLDPSRCYRENSRQMCCNACGRLKLSIPGCLYGDRRVAFNTPIGSFGCEQYIRIYGQAECKNPTIKSRCCASCYGIP